MAIKSKAERMYKDSPKLERKEDGKMGVSKKKEAVDKEAADIAKVPVHEEGMPVHIRHAMERSATHHRHETEHSMHPMHKDKKEMHARHEHEVKIMHKKHEDEMSSKGEK